MKVFETSSNLARAIGCTPSAIFQWPDPLPQRIADRVIAACVRAGLDPAPLLEAEQGGTTTEDTMKERRSAA